MPSYEERLNEVLKVLERYFNIEETFKLTHGTSGDRGRTFAVCSTMFYSLFLSRGLQWIIQLKRKVKPDLVLEGH